MADNPYAQYAANPYRPVYGSPRQPSPQTPAQATNDQLGVVQKQNDIAVAPIERQIKGVDLKTKELSLEQQQQAGGTGEQGMSAGFYGRALYANQKYGKGVPPRDPFTQGLADIAPTGIVNSLTGPERQKAETFARDFIAATLRKESGAAIGPQEYQNQYIRYFPQPGDNPDTIAEKANLRGTAILALRNQAGPLAARSEKQIQELLAQDQQGSAGSAVPVAAPQTQAGFDLKQDPRNTELSPEQAKAYDAFWGANPNPSPEQLVGFVQSMGVPGAMPIEQAKAIIDAKKAGRGISHDVQIKPDISDVRGSGGAAETLDAGIRGAADTASFGLADKIAAVGDTLTNGGSTLDQNLARQYAISDYDTQNHFPSRLAGQAVGGFAIPFGEAASVPQVALKGGAIGAGYGVGSSRSAGDVPTNALLGFAGGAAAGGTVAGIGRGINALRGGAKDVPPLVDQATGELNAPMDAMRPADRVQSMKDYGLRTVTPGMAGGRSARITEQVLNNLPASAGHMEDVYSAASKELRGSMQGVAQKFGTSKTLNEGGTELQGGAKEWMTRADRVDEKVYNAIPIAPEVPAILDGTKAALGQLSSKIKSNPDLAEEIKDPALQRYLDAIDKHGLSWNDLKQFRSFIGDKVGQFRFSQDARKGDYRALYGALSEDMRASAEAQGPKALAAFERANSFHAKMETRIEGALKQILGNDAQAAPERAAAAVQAMTMGGRGGGDLTRLAQIRASTIKSGAWDEIASTLIHLGGQPAKSEGRAFEPRTFVNWYADMAEPARRMLFKPELRKSLDGFVAMTQQLGKIRALNNNSNTGPLVMGGAQLLQFGKMIMSADVTGLAVQIGANAANYAMAKFWTTPKAVSLLTGYGRAVASGNQNAVKSQVGRLSKLAATNPELRAPIENLLKNIANDNAMLGAAASDSNSEEK